MPKRRRLGDLYATGLTVRLNDNSGEEPIEVWVQKLSPIEQESALRRASVERAKFLAATKDRDSELWQSTWADLHEFAPDKERLLPIALRDDLARIRARVEAEVADQDEWKEEGYLQSLVDAWEGTGRVPEGGTDERDEEVGEDSTDGEREPLKYVFHKADEDDPRYKEAANVYKEIERWSSEVQRIIEGERENLYKDWEHEPVEKVRDMAIEKMLEQASSMRMLDEFETQELFFSVREPNQRSKRYFESRDEVLSMMPEVRKQLADSYRSLLVESQEGKDLPGTPGSSLTSDSPVPEATSKSSGPEA